MNYDRAQQAMSADTEFVDPRAVEAWDTWFRWRDDGRLHDVTIDETWRRVAATVSAAEHEREEWANAFCEAFSSWRLLPDERLLRCAGTNRPWPRQGPLVAVLNVAAFVTDGSMLRLDRDALTETAGLAVRFLDDAGIECADCAELSIGLIGVADALRSLGIRYESRQAREVVQELGAALMQGCLQATITLARDRGPRAHPDTARLARWHALGIPSATIEDGRRFGLRHVRLTDVSRQPRLAQLANNVADGLDPCTAPSKPPNWRPPRNRASHASTPAAAGAHQVEAGCAPLVAQLELRAALQPWIDAPIDGPLLSDRRPDARSTEECRAAAERLGLPSPDWRFLEYS